MVSQRLFRTLELWKRLLCSPTSEWLEVPIIPRISETAPSQKTAQWVIFWKLFSLTAHGWLMRIKIIVCNSTSRPKLVDIPRLLITCATILQCTYRFGNQTAVLRCGLKKEPLKKRLTRSAEGQSGLVALVNI